jgi:hypothetical protein
MSMSLALGCRIAFLCEQRNNRPGTKTRQSQVVGFPFTAQPYMRYGEVSSTAKNAILRQDTLRAAGFAGWQSKGAHGS